MRLRLTNGVWVGLAVSAFARNISKGILIAAILEVVSIIFVNIFWIVKKYAALVPGSFMSSIILPNTSPSIDNFAYEEVLVRIYLRAIALVCMILWPVAWPICLIFFTLTLLYK